MTTVGPDVCSTRGSRCSRACRCMWCSSVTSVKTMPRMRLRERTSFAGLCLIFNALYGTTCWVRCRSEEHTSELQSRENLVCRPLLEQKTTGVQHAPAHLVHAR